MHKWKKILWNEINYMSVHIIGNCFEQLIVIVIKSLYKGKIDFYSLAVEDLSFRRRYDNDGYFVRNTLKCENTG